MQSLLAAAAPPEAASVPVWMMIVAVVSMAGAGLVGWYARCAIERSARRDVEAYESELVRAANCARDRALSDKSEVEARYQRLHGTHAECESALLGMQTRLRDRDGEVETLKRHLGEALSEAERNRHVIEELQQRVTDVQAAAEERVRLDGAPEWLRALPDGPKDDLTAIRGLGSILEQRLNAMGVFHFSQLAQMTAEHADWIAPRINVVPGRLIHDRWAEQARRLQSASD